ncbi:MAG: hypothetical protein HC841_03495 [Verrucomicrobiae bacterium]|nr:hypothetical protein [Verrucomicrobiae bacterium]
MSLRPSLKRRLFGVVWAAIGVAVALSLQAAYYRRRLARLKRNFRTILRRVQGAVHDQGETGRTG